MRLLLCCCLIPVLFGCKQKYEPPITSPATGYLVVEGIISANGPAEIHLSRTIPLADSARSTNERSALVRLEGTNGNRTTLFDNNNGVYTYSQLNLSSNEQYRLYIKTKDGKEYASNFVKVKTAPPIDSISWVYQNDGVQLHINTHDPLNNTWYYRWETEETWEFHSNEYTVLDFQRNPTTLDITGVKYRYPDHRPEESLYTCWQYENSTKLLLGSSAKLSEDVIHLPLLFVPKPSWKLSELYSINVKQYALSKDEYDFLQKMKRNSEETGSIFDRQPSELKGNIHCLSKPEEPVIGFIGIANRYEKRIWIKRSDVPGWGYYMSCLNLDIPADSAAYFSNYAPYMPSKFTNSGAIERYYATDYVCIDCTLRGTNVKPSFWP